MTGLVSFSVRRRVTVLMVALATVAFGIVGYDRLSLDLLPNISYPSITVRTEFPDTAPAEVENLVTRPVEETVGVLQGLRSIHSVSRTGASEVTLEFDWDTDMDMLSLEVREKLDRMTLPEEADRPIVMRFDPSLDPIIRLAVTGSSDLAAMRRTVERRLKPELETIDGVAAAQIKGGLEEEIQIEVDQSRLAALGIPLDRIQGLVAASNVNLPGGSLEDVTSQYLLRTVNEFRTVEEIGELVLRQDEAGIVRLRDVATVVRGTEEREEITRLDGRECVEIAIYKEGDANTVTVAEEVHARLGLIGSMLPRSYTVETLFDQSRFISQAISEVRTAALVGGVLAVLVLFAFLRDIRSTVIIATAIPLSIIATFMVMYRADVTLNIMSLGGLTLGVGMLVDNAIVVLESIHRERGRGRSLAAAAIAGTGQVGGAVVASTLTTVAVFLPIVFVEGIAGQLFGDMALTVTFSLLASLAIAVTLIPMLSALGREPASPGDAGAGPAGTAGPERSTRPVRSERPQSLGGLSRGYDRFLTGALRHRLVTLGIAALLFGASLFAAAGLGTELIPKITEGEFYFDVTMPEGTSLEGTDRVVRHVEAGVVGRAGVDHAYSTVGSRLVAGGMSLATHAENLGQLNVVLADRADQARERELADSIRAVFADIPDVVAKEGAPTYFSLRTPVEILLFGENVDDLRAASETLVQRLRAVPGLVDIRPSLEEGSPEVQVVFDRARVAALGLDVRALSMALRDRVQGDVATRYKEGDDQINVRVRNREADRSNVADVKNLVLPGPDGTPIRLVTVAEIVESRGPAESHRVQQQRAAVVSANVDGRSLGAVVGDVERVIAAAPLPVGVSVEVGGQNQEMQVSFDSLRFAIGLAIFLVYLVMAATFESLLHPFIVLFSIPLALVGVVAALFATGTTISVIVLIGAVMLVGIVVNNAIVLIDTINRHRRAGMEKREAVVQACHLRLRPILMTTATTVLGLLPMALGLGEGSELRAPMAITVSSGLLLSTLLTLVVIPATYMLVPSRITPETGDLEAARVAPGGPLPAAPGHPS